MRTMDVTVRLQALDGTWETCGADRAIQVVPESLVATSDAWGPEKASFTLRRSAIAIWPDIGAYTPVEIEIGGVVVWKGRVKESPTKPWTINVQCVGWQYHLDDDTYRRIYVHSKLTDWKDTRSLSTANLVNMCAAAQVQVGAGAIVLTFPQGQAVPAGRAAGVTLDLGEAAAKTVVAKYKTSNNTPNKTVWIIGHDDPDWTIDASGSARLDFLEHEPINKAAENSVTKTITAAKRYITILLWTETEETPGADVWVRFESISVYSDSTFQSKGLKASTVIKDALERGTMLLSSDRSQIDAKGEDTFNIPDYCVEKHATPREVIEAVNSYHNWVTKLDGQERMVFSPRPTAPQLEIGSWDGSEVEDTSANSGDEIYNRAVVEATGPDGSALTVDCAAQATKTTSEPIGSPVPVNPGFATDTSGWTASAGTTLTRDESFIFDAPASGKAVVEESAVHSTLETGFTGTFKRGVKYRLVFHIAAQAALFEPVSVKATFGGSANAGSVNSFALGNHAFNTYAIDWTPTVDQAGTLKLEIARSGGWAGGYTFWVDALRLEVTKPTLIDRRGFRRAKIIQVNSAITRTEGERLGEIFLQGHATTPFKGNAKIQPGGVRKVLGGQEVHPSRLLLHTQELLRLSHMIDPDTGGLGRDGTIASVTYTHKDQTAQVSLDENRSNFDALLNRLAVVQGVGS